MFCVVIDLCKKLYLFRTVTFKRGRIALFMILDARIVVKRILSCKQTHIHTSVGENQQKNVLKNLRYRSAFHFIGIGSFQGWGNMKPCKKSFDRFRNMLIILSRLCYTFIHSMSLRFVIVFWQLNYIKTIGFILFLCQLL